MNKQQDGESLLAYLQRRMELYKEQGDSRAAKLLALVNRLKGFRDGADIALSAIDAEYVRAFSDHLRGEGLAANTVGFYLRYFRAEYNAAAKEGLVENARPFAGVKIEKVAAEKQALAMSDIVAIKNLDLSKRKSLAFARDMFMFSFYAQGMELVDMAYLGIGNIRNGQIVFKRRRSGQTESVAWLPEMQAIIDRQPDRLPAAHNRRQEGSARRRPLPPQGADHRNKPQEGRGTGQHNHARHARHSACDLEQHARRGHRAG